MKNKVFRKILIVLLFIVVLLGIIVIINKFFFNKSKVSFYPKNSTIKIEQLNSVGHIINSFQTNVSITKTFNNGFYDVIYQSNNPNYQPVNLIINLTKNISLKTPSFNYKPSYLNQLFNSERNQIHLAFINSSYGYLIKNLNYQFGFEELLGNGNWYIARLYPNNPLKQDSLVYIMQKVNNLWKLETTPSIVLYTGNYPSIPVSYLQIINNTPYSNLSSENSSSNTIMSVVTQYINARENNIGSNQSSPSSWVNNIKNILSSNFYNQIISSYNNSLTGQESNDYITAHNNGFIINANLSNCSFYQNNPSTTSVSCSLSDTVIYQNDNLLVPINNIPFGFIHSGTQPFVSLGLIKQNGQWLINSDQNF